LQVIILPQSPTLRDVAKYAGVSLGTASRALNNKQNILPETRSLVLRAASELGYKLQFRVASSVSSKLNTIGVVIKREPYNSTHIDIFNYGIMCGIEDECQRLGLNMMFATMPVDNFSYAIDTASITQETSVDGLLMVGIILHDEQLCKYLPHDKPTVFVDGCAFHGEYDCIVIDNHNGACRAVSYLIEQGHQHIALIGSAVKDTEHPSIVARRLGYLQTLANAGINQTYMPATTMDLREIKDATRQLLLEHPEITAIFACNDLIATEIIPVIAELGRSVPHDISVIGFDDVELAAKSAPPLTTMHVDRALLGALAVRRLYDRAANLESVPVKTTIGTRLISRQSVSTNSQFSNGHHGE
jgi:LacI family transcriptional regulator